MGYLKGRGLCDRFFTLSEKEIALTYCLDGKVHSASLMPGEHTERILGAIKAAQEHFKNIETLGNGVVFVRPPRN